MLPRVRPSSFMRLAAVLFLASVTAFAQAKKAAPRPPVAKKAPAPTVNADAAPLASFRVTGNQNFTRDQIFAVSELRLGQPMTQKDFDLARDKLVAAGVFETVGYRYDYDGAARGYAAVFEVREIQQAFPFRFDDLPGSDAEWRKALQAQDPLFAPKLVATKERIELYAARLTALAQAKGLNDTVLGKVEPDAAGQLTVVFKPATAPTNIGQVTFQGNEVLDTATLNNAFFQIAVGVPWKEPVVRELLHTGIRPLYENKGRMKVAFGKIDAVKMKDINGYALTIEVNEGPEFVWGQVGATGRGLGVKEVTQLAGLKEGDAVVYQQALDATGKIEAALKRLGYLKAKVAVERQIRDKTKSVDLVFKQDAGEVFTFGALKIVGLDITSEPEIRKIWALQPGRPFNADYPQFFLNQVREQGLFDNLKRTRFETKLNERDLTADVTLYFR
jgi:outer membrane protein assembly factor BamA